MTGQRRSAASTAADAATDVHAAQARVGGVAPLLVAFLIFQRQFVQSFMRTGIR
jgi:sn-glycerol 3-phosphate transport system permease protein